MISKKLFLAELSSGLLPDFENSWNRFGSTLDFSVVNVTWLGVRNTTGRGSGNNHPLQKVHKRALHTITANEDCYTTSPTLLISDASPRLCNARRPVVLMTLH